MPAALTGGCLCGAIRYESSAEPIRSFNCHCRDCQKATGGAFVPADMVPASALKITGQPKFHSVTANSRNIMTRGFCPKCGSRLFARTSHLLGFIGIYAGTLDDPSQHRPTVHFWTASAQPWDHMDPALQKLPGNPPS